MRQLPAQQTRFLVIAPLLLLGLFAVSGYKPYDRATWAMEACIFLHALVLMLGGAYTCARVPLGFQIQEVLGLRRNPYDKIGHFFQGFVPALAAREILIRGEYVRGRWMLAFVVACIVLAISATYEFIEWGAALALGQGADDLGGDRSTIDRRRK